MTREEWRGTVRQPPDNIAALSDDKQAAPGNVST
jgi:hypothetical protein